MHTIMIEHDKDDMQFLGRLFFNSMVESWFDFVWFLPPGSTGEVTAVSARQRSSV